MSSNPSHKPRKKRRDLSSFSAAANQDLVVHDKKINAAKPAFPLVAFLWPAQGTTSRWITLPIILMTVGLFRWTVGLWDFSGFNMAPMHGDFEAQRHWMEITSHLPVSMWYFYDLQYWGLDYPPLTAYHSWVCGKIGSIIDPAWFALDTSRGAEGHLLKIFMRATVIVSEYLTYIPAVVVFQRQFGRMNSVGGIASAVALVAVLMQPATLLIDHGHFQYNTVMLGFVTAAVSCFMTNHVLWGSALFVAALGFKQMALYYSPVVFAYLLGACFSPSIRPGRLILIGAVTIISFVVLFAPLLLGAVYNDYRETPSINAKLPPPALLTEALRNLSVDIDSSSYAYTILLQASQSVYRIFPFARGLFEDKVANFWCVLNHAVIKLSALPTSIPLPRLSLYFTLIPISPASIILLINPRKSILLPALASCAWGFFLFSFQVHEKSVLLPLLPMTLLLFSNKGLSPSIRAWVGLANILGTWTLYPLLKRDDLRTPYAVITFLWSYLLGLPPTSISLYIPQTSAMTNEATTSDTPNLLTTLTHISLYAAMLFWHALEAFLPPPQNKPDLWVVLNVIIGSAGFSLCYLWCTWKVVLGSGMLDNIIEKLEQRKAKNQKKTKQLQLQSQKQHQQQQQHSVRSSPSPQTNGNGTGKGGKKR